MALGAFLHTKYPADLVFYDAWLRDVEIDLKFWDLVQGNAVRLFTVAEIAKITMVCILASRLK